MRNFREPTYSKLLRQPLVLGVNMTGLLGLVFLTSLSQVILPSSPYSNLLSISIASIGYIALRILAKHAKIGWEESFIFWLEDFIKKPMGKIEYLDAEFTIQPPTTMDLESLIYQKEQLEEKIKSIGINESISLVFRISVSGAEVSKIKASPGDTEFESFNFIYSLTSLPVVTDPLFMTGVLSKIREAVVFVRIDGLNQLEVKGSIERSRKNNAQNSSDLSNIDSEVSFSDASEILEGISKGSEHVVSVSVVIASNQPMNLDPGIFTLEKSQLSLFSVTGLRKRSHRAIRSRLVTAVDLLPTFLDAKEEGRAILKTRNGFPLYFSPLDQRLESLHWIVVGATGTGKSFFTALLLKRLIEGGEKISAIFIDHRRSYRRLVLASSGAYIEPKSILELKSATQDLLLASKVGAIQGIELSNLPFKDKKEAACFLLEAVERHLSSRNSFHPIYIVLDECWNFLRDEPVLVQRAFREYRKLNGAVVAITQSLTDFLNTENGESIFQNSPIRILLRQGEDLTPFKGQLEFNDVELKLSRRLQQSKGEYSECLIKTPYLSRLGRLYPTLEEYELLRTDNLKEVETREAKCASF